MSPTSSTPASLDRRTVLRCAGAACVGAGAAVTLAACGGSDEGSGGTAATTGSTATTEAGSGGGVSTSDIPVGGGTVYAEAGYVVTQPTEGQFKAFSSMCTHQNLPVGGVADGTIDCFNHGSKFDITTGAVVNGPATTALPTKTVTVDGDTITVS